MGERFEWGWCLDCKIELSFLISLLKISLPYFQYCTPPKENAMFVVPLRREHTSFYFLMVPKLKFLQKPSVDLI